MIPWTPRSRQVVPYQLQHFTVFRHMLVTPLTTLELQLEKMPVHSQKISHKIMHSAVQRMYQVCDAFTTESFRNHTESFTISTLITTSTVLAKRNTTHFYVVYQNEHIKSISLRGNKLLLEESLICLLTNAIEAYTSSKNAYAVITIGVKNKKLYISIRDFGIGMPWWKQKTAILPFISFKKYGSGVGLSFAKQVIEEHWHGQLQIISKNNFGTEVICELPCRC